MKKVLIYFAMAVVLALGSTSCSDFLEIEPVGAVNETNLTIRKVLIIFLPACIQR